MDDDVTSAIDDSGPTRVLGFTPHIARSDAGYRPINFEYGRREGHWAVGETVFGSAIDDGCPTVIQLPRTSSRGGEAGQVNPLDSAALKKLKKASEEDEKRKIAMRAAEETRERENNAAAAVLEAPKATPEVKGPPKGFYVPQRGLSIKIVSQDGKCEVVMRPQPAAKSMTGLETKTEKAPKPAPASEPPAKAESKAPSAVSRPGSTTRRVKIVGKNGEEAFVELPAGLNAGEKTRSHVCVPAVPDNGRTKKAANPVASAPKELSKEEKAQQQQKAANAANALRTKRERQEKEAKARKEQEAAEAATELHAQRGRQQQEERELRERQAKAAAEVLMSGGLGSSSKTSSSRKAASAHTVKSASSRSASVLNGQFGNTSKPPSKASSRTTVPPRAQVASVRAASHVSSQKVKTVSIQGWDSVGSNTVESHKAASNIGWAGWPAEPAPAADAQASEAVSAKTASQGPSQRSKTPFQQNRQQAGSGAKAPSQPPANDPWEGISAIYKIPSFVPAPSPAQPPPPSQAEQQRRKASTPPSRPASITSSQISRKVAGIHHWNNNTPSHHSRVPSAATQPSPAPPALPTINVRRANNASQDTIFAGTGWISPHPLSRAPTEFEPPPQDQISIQGATMTYEEWRRLQEEQRSSLLSIRGIGAEFSALAEESRRNISRTSSEGGTQRGGIWGGPAGFADAWAPAGAPACHGRSGRNDGSTVRDGSAVAGQDDADWSVPNYHVPTVVSEYSHHSQQSQQSQRSAVRSVRSGQSSSAGPSEKKSSFNDCLPPVGFWNAPPQVDGAGSFTGRRWREPARRESLVLLGSMNGRSEGAERRDGNGNVLEPVQLRMPWDCEAVLDRDGG